MKKIALSLALAIALQPVVSFGDDFNETCGEASGLTGQKASYCAAARQSRKAAKTSGVLWKLHAAVAATCTASCLASSTIFASAAAQQICQGSALGVTIADITLTKNFMGSFGSLITGGIGFANALENDFAMEFGKKKIQLSCFTAATEALASFMGNQSEAQSKQVEKQNLEYAKRVDADKVNVYQGFNKGASTTSTATKLAGTTSTAAQVSTGGDSSAAADSACSDTGSASGAISCAATADPVLANRVANPEFQKAFEKSSGMKLGDFLKGAENLDPKTAMKAGAGAALSSEALTKMDAALAAVQNAKPDFNQNPEGSYASRGGASSSSDSGMPDMASMMNGLMSQLAPKKEEDKQKGVTELKFSGPKRNLASVTAEDSTVSLFDRVAFRYNSVTQRLFIDPKQQNLKDWSAAPRN